MWHKQTPLFQISTASPFFINTTTSSGGLTQVLANKLYLQKLVPDTIAVLETFNGGIQAINIDTSTTATTLVIVQTNARQVNVGNPSSLNIVNGRTSSMNMYRW